jgi:hypothetical protein
MLALDGSSLATELPKRFVLFIAAILVVGLLAAWLRIAL